MLPLDPISHHLTSDKILSKELPTSNGEKVRELQRSDNAEEHCATLDFHLVGWKLVDINFVLKGNYPFHFANFKDERSINAIARDASFPFHVTSAEHPRAREDGYTVVTKQGAKPDKEEDFPVMST